MKISITKSYDLPQEEIDNLKALREFGHSWNHECEMDELVSMGLAREDNLDGKVTLSANGRLVLEQIDLKTV